MKNRPMVTSWVRDEIRNLRRVEHGGEVWKHLGNPGEILDFSSNVNPLGAPPKIDHLSLATMMIFDGKFDKAREEL
ncbi:TPA: hypothetical protein EYP27_00310, partial [Candidatus Bathyarchaeota archaeon]|nr:hypothetical protein [Candidatus Bathyarchaeota archaeon]